MKQDDYMVMCYKSHRRVSGFLRVVFFSTCPVCWARSFCVVGIKIQEDPWIR